MKKLLLALFTFMFALILTGCDLFEDKGMTDLWYDQENGVIVLSYDITAPSQDADTGETPMWELHLEAKHEEDTDWQLITVLDSFKADQLEVPFNNEKFGNYDIRISVVNEGSSINDFGPWNIWIEEPQFLYHFNVWFDGWNGAVNVDYGLDYRNIDKLELQKSNDGGLTWDFVMDIEVSEDFNQVTYYEFEEGNYVFKLRAFNNDELVEELTSYHEINVYFEKDKFTGDPEIWYAEASFDIWSKQVHIWWDCQGEFETTKVFKSTDMENWEEIEEIPYYVKSLSYTEETDGVYYYKVELQTNNGNPSIVTNETRVRENAILNDINGWYDYNAESININWDFFEEAVEVVLIERKVDEGDFELIGEFGNLKKMFTDEDLVVGMLVYRVTVFDSDGNMLDSLESPEFFVEQKQYLYNIWTWHNWDSEHIEIGVEYWDNNDFMLVLEKSVNGGEFEPVEQYDNYYFKDPITEEGDYVYRARVVDAAGNVLEEMQTEVYDVQFPSYIYHFDVWHDSQSGKIEFNMGLHQKVDSVTIYKSTDGGLTWLPLLDQAVQMNEDGWFSDRISYIEDEEGEYVYKVEAYNADGFLIDELTSNYEIVVNYDHLNLDGEIDIYHVDASFNIYDNMVYIWFGTSGDYDHHMIERSVDGENFEFVATVSRFITSYSFTEDVEGEYFYRISAVSADGVTVDSMTTNYTVRVKFDALINYLYAHHMWENDIEVYFEFEGEDVSYITVTRTNVDTNEVFSLGQFGNLKHIVKDEELVPGTYFYTVSLFDADGNVLDEMDTNEITIHEQN